MPNVEGRKQVANESSLPNDDRWCSIMWFLIMNKTKPFDFINNRDYFFVSNFLILSGAFMLCNQNKSIHCNKQEKNFFLFFASIQFVLVWPSKYLNLCLLVFSCSSFVQRILKKKTTCACFFIDLSCANCVGSFSSSVYLYEGVHTFFKTIISKMYTWFKTVWSSCYRRVATSVLLNTLLSIWLIT